MCKMCDEKHLNLHCQNCGSSKVIPTNDKHFVKGELGLSYMVRIYKCTECNTKFLICPECNGTGVVLKQLDYADYNDCDVCYGMGLVKLNNVGN